MIERLAHALENCGGQLLQYSFESSAENFV